MSDFSELKSLVDSNQVDVLNIVAVPRSMSTALGRLLSQGSFSVFFVNEPFNRHNQDVEVAASEILGPAQQAVNNSSQKPTLVVKNMATYLSDEAFGKFDSISKHTLWSVREPLLQMGSLLTRMVNDMVFETGAAELEQGEIAPYLAAVSAQLQDSKLSSQFSRTGWEAIRRHYDAREEHSSLVIVDGTLLSRSPEYEIQRVCAHINLPYSTTMVSGWDKGYTNINTGSSRHNTEENAWTKDAATNSSVVANDRQPLDINLLPEAMRTHIVDIAIPAYEHMVGEH